MSGVAKRWFYNKRPKGDLESDTLALREVALAPLQPGEILVRTIYLSMDATNRIWLSEWDSYMPPIRIGDPMLGIMIGEVEESRNPAFPAGSLVSGIAPWSDRFVTDGAGFFPFPRFEGLDLADAFGVLMVAGPTAYHGLFEIGQPKPGETVVISAAAGAVGMLVGQLAKIQGCRAVGIAGSDEKCRWLTQEMGFDAAVNYRQGDLVEALRAATPNGIDVLFENVGGTCLDAGLTLMNNGGRVVICGLIASYNSTEPVPGPYMFRNMIMKRLKMEGFVILDHFDRYPEYQAKLAGWMREGKLKHRLHVVEGIDNALTALKLLYTGGNDGKVMVRMS